MKSALDYIIDAPDYGRYPMGPQFQPGPYSENTVPSPAPSPLPPSTPGPSYSVSAIEQARRLQSALAASSGNALAAIANALNIPTNIYGLTGIASGRPLPQSATVGQIQGVLDPALWNLPELQAIFGGTAGPQYPNDLRAFGLRPDRFGYLRSRAMATPEALAAALMALAQVSASAT